MNQSTYWKRIGRGGQWVLILNGREMASVPPLKQDRLRWRFYNLSVFKIDDTRQFRYW